MKLAIFDLDGTLLNTIGDLAGAGNAILQKHGFPPHNVEKYNSFVGNGIPKLVERTIPQEARSEELISVIKDEFINYYKSNLYVYTKPYKMIPELLAELQKQNVQIAVASNKFQEGVDILLKHFFPEINFAAAFGSSSNMPTKPNSTMVDTILEITGISNEDTIFIGDSNVDMLTGKNSNIKPVGVAWGFRTVEELTSNGAWKIVYNPMDILKFI